MFCYYKISNYDVIGLSEVLVENHLRNADIKTLTDIVAFKIDKIDLQNWMVKYPNFYYKIISNVIDRLHSTLRNHIECKKYTSHANIVSYLIYSYNLYKRIYKENYRDDVKINETRSMISDFIGISIRSTNNSIDILKNKNLVTIKYGKIYINQEQYIKLVEYKEELLM
jgi:CRP-like cAMP-binding protein